ncbi:Fur family transcriptional regulator [Faecalimicrobium sp. JNUCC 81]
MNKKTEYKTKQREIILDYLKENKDRHVTIDDVFKYLEEQGNKVGRTTVYRYMEKLTNDDLLRKYYIEEGAGSCYQYIGDHEDCHQHFHMKCTECKELIHLECSYLEDVNNHILKEHNFIINNAKTVFYGICNNCRGKSER